MKENRDILFPKGAAEARAVVRPLRFRGDTDALAAGLRTGSRIARAELYDRTGPMVRRLLARVLGADSDIPDLMQEVYAQAFTSARTLQDSESLGPWMASIAIHVARRCIRRRRYERWLGQVLPSTVPVERMVAWPADIEGRESLRCAYAVLEMLSAEERIAFALRYIDGMELVEVAEVTGVSLATIKRRLARARRRFAALAKRYPALERWVFTDTAKGGTR